MVQRRPIWKFISEQPLTPKHALLTLLYGLEQTARQGGIVSIASMKFGHGSILQI